VAGLREALDAPDLPFVTCQLNRVAGVPDAAHSVRWAEVREWQRRAARDLARVAVVPTLDAGLSDGIHLDPPGNLRVGARAARAALGLAYGLPVRWRTPDLASARFDGPDRGAALLRFGHVAGGLWQTGTEIRSFTAADADGGVAVRKAALAGPDTVRLEFVRPLGDGAAVSLAAHHNPPVCLRDRDGCPPLAFHRAPVEPA